MPEISRFLGIIILMNWGDHPLPHFHARYGVTVMFLHTTHVEPRPSYRLHVSFDNGISGEIDLSAELWGEMFEPLKDGALFATARHDEALRTVVWANGADLAPEFLFDLLVKQTGIAA